MGVLTMFRGDSKTVTETVGPFAANGAPALGSGGVTGWSFWFTAKYDSGDADSAAVFQKLPAAWQVTQAGNGTLGVNSTPGIVFCNLAPADTAGLPPYQVVLVYDVQAKDVAGNIFTIDEGTLTVTADVTIATT